jgi:NAD(P)-dependent dehydrogenase (short-subunit alcohol dehydrogenase family)
MPTLEASNTSHFAAKAGDSPPVAVFIGGTSGIGEAMVRAFAQYTNGKASIAIIGRNKQAGERILSELPKADGVGAPERVFIQCDVSLMQNVSSAAKQLTTSFTKINYLIVSTGFLDFSERKETLEGLEYRLAVSYYSRWFFIRELVGLVEKAKGDGEETAVMSILAPGYGGEIDQEDWGIKRGYSTLKVVYAAVTYNDLMVESFAEHHPSVPFIHAHPGMVRTPIFGKSPSLIWKIIGLLVNTIGRPFTIAAGQSAESMWNAILNVNQRGAHIGWTPREEAWRRRSIISERRRRGKGCGNTQRARFRGVWKFKFNLIIFH